MIETAPASAEPLSSLLDLLASLERSDCLLRQRSSVERADGLARQSVQLDIHLQGRLRLLMARLYAQLCHHERSFACGMEASQLLERASDLTRALQASYFCIAACIETGDTPRALELSRDALEKARKAGDSGLLARLLSGQALALFGAEETEAAVLCADEALQLPGVPQGDHDYARALQAALRAHLAKAAQSRGELEQAAALRARAREQMPQPEANSPIAVVHLVLYAWAVLGDLRAARPHAGEFARRVRRLGSSPYWTIQCLLTMGMFHSQAGAWDKAAARLERAVRKMLSVGRVYQLSSAIEQLAAAHAAAGRHGDALRWLRQMQAGPASESARLHGRMVALQRDAEWRRVERETALLHTQRLAVVGRLMTQIYHALEAPLVKVSESLAGCLEQAESVPPQQLAGQLRAVVSHVDQASALAKQLKMFSYRAAPQSMALDMRAALHEAWQGMASSRSLPLPPLQLKGEAPPPVRGDAQRLAVLLRILLIEIERMAGGKSPRVSVSIRGQAVRVEFACQGIPGASPMAPGVGFTLCHEIAREMQGGLWRSDGLAGELLVALELPLDS